MEKEASSQNSVGNYSTILASDFWIPLFTFLFIILIFDIRVLIIFNLMFTYIGLSRAKELYLYEIA